MQALNLVDMFGKLKIHLKRQRLLQFATQNLPFSCTENVAACYQKQFPDSSIAKYVTIGPSKMSYLVLYELGPYLMR